MAAIRGFNASQLKRWVSHALSPKTVDRLLKASWFPSNSHGSREYYHPREVLEVMRLHRRQLPCAFVYEFPEDDLSTDELVFPFERLVDFVRCIGDGGSAGEQRWYRARTNLELPHYRFKNKGSILVDRLELERFFRVRGRKASIAEAA